MDRTNFPLFATSSRVQINSGVEKYWPILFKCNANLLTKELLNKFKNC